MQLVTTKGYEERSGQIIKRRWCVQEYNGRLRVTESTAYGLAALSSIVDNVYTFFTSKAMMVVSIEPYKDTTEAWTQ